MKRPTAFYFVAAWCCLALLMQVSALTRPVRAYQAAGDPIPIYLSLLPLLTMVFVIWQTVGLVQMKPFNRWFAVVFFGE